MLGCGRVSGPGFGQLSSGERRLRRNWCRFSAGCPPVSGGFDGAGADFRTVLRRSFSRRSWCQLPGCPPVSGGFHGVGASLPIVPSGTHGFAGGTASSTAGAAALTYIQRIKIAITKRQELLRTVASSEFLPLTIFGDHRSQLVRKRLMRLDAYEIGYSYKTYFLQTRFIAIE